MGYINHILRKKLTHALNLSEWQAVPYEEKQYARDTVQKMNLVIKNEGVSDGLIVEIGCGLGDIIGGINTEGTNISRLGIDIKKENIVAAKCLHPSFGNRKLRFMHGSFEIVRGWDIYILVMVNVLHTVSPEEVKREISKILSSCNAKYIVMDEIKNTSAIDYLYEQNGDYLFGDYGYKRKYSGKRISANGNAYRKVVFFEKEKK